MLPGVISLSFFCDAQMVWSEFGNNNNMKAQSHPSLYRSFRLLVAV